MRAEEVVLSVPDGRSVRTLVNATPIRTEDGAVASLVITVQDLAPLDEIERMRTEFLGLVSHELREPLAAIKGSATTLLEDAAALDPAEMREFHRIIVEQSNHMRGLISDLLDAGRIDSGRALGRAGAFGFWPSWWSGRGAPSWAAAGGTASRRPCRRHCPARWPTGGASCRC